MYLQRMNDMKFLVDLINNGVPIVFGSIDQKHIIIQKPKNGGS